MTVLNPPIAQAATTTNADDVRAQIVAGMGGTLLMTPRAGIAAGWGAELSVAQSGTPAMNVVVGSGQCLVAAPTAGHGGWWVINDGNLTLPIAAANATNPRTDLIIARVADPTYHTGGDGLAAIKVITGTAGAGAPVPTVPTADGAHIVLARVAVAANATSITNANITLNTSTSRPMVGPGRLQAAANTDIPLVVTAAASQASAWTEWRNSAGVVLLSVDSAGRLNFTSSTTTATAGASGAPPAQVQGYISVGVGGVGGTPGTQMKIPYYNA